MAFKKYAVEDNCSAKLATAIDKTSTKIRLKEAVNLPTEGEWIATLIKKQGEVLLKMEKVLVLKRELDVLTVQRGFQSKSQEWEENDQLNLYITAEIIKDIQREIEGKKVFTSGLQVLGEGRRARWGESLILKKQADQTKSWSINGRSDQDDGLLFEFVDDGYYNNFLFYRKGGIKFEYFTDSPHGLKRDFIIASRSAITGRAHNEEGYVTQVLWGDLSRNPDDGNDGGWGLRFGAFNNPYLSMQNATTRIGRTDGEVEIKSPKVKFNGREVDFDVQDLTLNKTNRKEVSTLSLYAKATNGTPGGIHSVDYLSGTPNWLNHRQKQLRLYLDIEGAVKTFDSFQHRGYEGFDGTEASLTNTQKFIKLDVPKIYLHDGTDIMGYWQSRTPTNAHGINEISSSACYYKVIGKIMFVSGVLSLKAGSSQEIAITLPHSVKDSGCAVELRGPGSFQFTRGYGQAVGGALWFHAGDNNIPINQNVVLRFNAVLHIE